MSIVWNTGLAAARARHNLKLKKNKKKSQAASAKRQAASAKVLTTEEYKILWDKYNA